MMKKRNVVAVLLLPLITFGIYSLYWQVVTKDELNAQGAQIPTAWLLIVPFVNIWWLWKYSEGVEHVSAGKTQGVLAFILLWILGSIGQAILQDGYNKMGSAPFAPAPVDMNPPASPMPPVEPTPPTVL